MTKRSRQARPIAPPLNFSTANRPPPGSRIATPSVNNNHLLFFSCSPCYLVSFFLFADRQPDLGPHFAIHVSTRLFTNHSIVHRGNRRRDLSRDPLAIKRLRNLVDLWRATGWSGGYTRVEGVWRRTVRLVSFLPLPFSFFFSSILDLTFVLLHSASRYYQELCRIRCRQWRKYISDSWMSQLRLDKIVSR